MEKGKRSIVQLMGVLNLTPDSFYDGGQYLSAPRALRRAEILLKEGADWLDLGGESTRPGSQPVPLAQEIQRVLPALKAIRKHFPKSKISIDTQKAEVARLALDEGADMINDVSALQADPEMASLLLRRRPHVTLMHMKGNPQNMQRRARYENVVREVKNFLSARAKFLTQRGFPKNKIVVDPGIGFGKTLTHNLQILYNVRTLAELGFPVMIGASRKSFIGKILGSPGHPFPPEDRLEGSLSAALWAAGEGAAILRVHDVGATARALKIWSAIKYQ